MQVVVKDIQGWLARKIGRRRSCTFRKTIPPNVSPFES